MVCHMAAACRHGGTCIAPGEEYANKGTLLRTTCAPCSAHTVHVGAAAYGTKAFQSQSSKSIVIETASHHFSHAAYLP